MKTIVLIAIPLSCIAFALFKTIRTIKKNRKHTLSEQGASEQGASEQGASEWEDPRHLRRIFFEKCNEASRLREEIHRLESLLHHENSVSCDDCIFAFDGLCLHIKAEPYERLDKKECDRFMRPRKAVSKCTHRNIVYINKRSRDIIEKDSICLDCGTLFK